MKKTRLVALVALVAVCIAGWTVLGIDTLENWVVKLPCRRSMIHGSRMQL